MADITLRALDTLWAVDLILCEDTRETQNLLNFHKPKMEKPYPKLLSYNDYNRKRRIPFILQMLTQGQNVALVTDRGTPLVSDPGYNLVREVLALSKTNENVKLDVIPGASALFPALQLSGFPPDKFYFAGFLPKQRKRRQEILSNLPEVTVILYESPYRVTELLGDIKKVLGDQVEIAVCLELTKKFQTVFRGTVTEVIDQIKTPTFKGEVTVVLDLQNV